jgi:hypothetical protein
MPFTNLMMQDYSLLNSISPERRLSWILKGIFHYVLKGRALLSTTLEDSHLNGFFRCFWSLS